MHIHLAVQKPIAENDHKITKLCASEPQPPVLFNPILHVRQHAVHHLSVATIISTSS